MAKRCSSKSKKCLFSTGRSGKIAYFIKHSYRIIYIQHPAPKRWFHPFSECSSSSYVQNLFQDGGLQAIHCKNNFRRQNERASCVHEMQETVCEGMVMPPGNLKNEETIGNSTCAKKKGLIYLNIQHSQYSVQPTDNTIYTII